jgi:hypothetical protein
MAIGRRRCLVMNVVPAIAKLGDFRRFVSCHETTADQVAHPPPTRGTRLFALTSTPSRQISHVPADSTTPTDRFLQLVILLSNSYINYVDNPNFLEPSPCIGFGTSLYGYF